MVVIRFDDRQEREYAIVPVVNDPVMPVAVVVNIGRPHLSAYQLCGPMTRNLTLAPIATQSEAASSRHLGQVNNRQQDPANMTFSIPYRAEPLPPVFGGRTANLR
jgi:hypothetical protein